MPRRTVTDLLYSIQQLGLEAKLIKHERHDDAIDLDHQDEIIEHTIQGENEAPHEAEAGEITPQKTELSFSDFHHGICHLAVISKLPNINC